MSIVNLINLQDYRYSRRAFIGKGVATAVASVGHSQAVTEPRAPASATPSHVSRADLVYDQPVPRSEEGMPLGNGRMGTLVWTTPSQIRFQINRFDVYANNSYTNSFFERHNDSCGGCAYAEIDFGDSAEPPFAGPDFHQRLAMHKGTMTLTGRRVNTELLAWPAQDVIAIEVRPEQARTVQLNLRMLRHASQYFGQELETFAREHAAAVQTRSQMTLCQLIVRGNSIILTQEYREGDYYNKSAVAMTVVGRVAHPEIPNETGIRLTTTASANPFTVFIASASSLNPQEDVVAIATRQIESASSKGYPVLAQETADWWREFWSRGSIQLHSEDGVADFIEQNYTYFLYLMGASSRGRFPPKFNGMLWNTGGDLRTWGAQHWFANLSCYYEALFATNRLELMDPAFDMYTGMYDACASAARQQWGSQGIYIPETAYFDGLERLPDDVAAEMRELYLMRKPWTERSERFRAYSETKHPHSSRWNWIASGKWEKGRWVITERGSGPYGNVSHIFGSTAKIAYLYWRRYEFTQDPDWLKTRAYPMLKGAVEFYRNHPNVRKGSDGKYHIHYANSNESVWGARDTDEDLSAMRGVSAALLRASEILGADADMRLVWQEFLTNLTPLPLSTDLDALRPANYKGPQVFARGRTPAVKAGSGVLHDANSLPMWFFDLCNPDSPDPEMLRIANSTFDSYFHRGITAQTPVSVLSKLPIAASTLGRSDAVRQLIPNQIRAIAPERSTSYKNGGVLSNRMTLREGPQALDAERLGRAAEALHLALLQSSSGTPGGPPTLRLFPAWPKEWNARFTLLARGGFLVTSSVENGVIPSVELVSNAGVHCRVRNPWPGASVEVFRGGASGETLNGDWFNVSSERGEQIILKPKKL